MNRTTSRILFHYCSSRESQPRILNCSALDNTVNSHLVETNLNSPIVRNRIQDKK